MNEQKIERERTISENYLLLSQTPVVTALGVLPVAERECELRVARTVALQTQTPH